MVSYGQCRTAHLRNHVKVNFTFVCNRKYKLSKKLVEQIFSYPYLHELTIP